VQPERAYNFTLNYRKWNANKNIMHGVCLREHALVWNRQFSWTLRPRGMDKLAHSLILWCILD